MRRGLPREGKVEHTEHGEGADAYSDPEVVVLVREHVGHSVDEGDQRDRKVDRQESLPARRRQLEHLRVAGDASICGRERESGGSRTKTRN